MKASVTKWLIAAVICIVAVAVIILVVYKVKNKVSASIQGIKNINDANEEIAPSQLTMTPQQYNTLASKIYTAVKGLGTDEQALYDAFDKLSTRSDLMQLTSAFGTRDNMTLAEWIADDCNANEIAHINSILASKGIVFTF